MDLLNEKDQDIDQGWKYKIFVLPAEPINLKKKPMKRLKIFFTFTHRFLTLSIKRYFSYLVNLLF